LLTQNYYHFLDLGYKLTATAGSDFPWCGNGPTFGTEAPSWNARIGNVRFYTHLEGEFTYDAWKSNLKAGHTFVSSGPILKFSVNDKLPGDELKLSESSKLTIKAEAFGHREQVPLSRLEIIAHGEVIGEITSGKDPQSLENLKIELNVNVEKGIWIAARCFAGPTQVAHTTPVYVTVNDQGFHNEETLEEYLALNEKYLKELEQEIESPDQPVNKGAWWYKKGLKKRIADTRQIIKSLSMK